MNSKAEPWIWLVPDLMVAWMTPRAGAAEFSCHVAGVHAELLHGFDGREEGEGVGERLVVVDAIKDVVVGLGRQAVDRERAAAGFAIAEGLGVAVDAAGY